MRRFSLNPATSHLDLLPDIGSFNGFEGYLDLAAGVPDPVTGLAPVSVVGSSTYLTINVGGMNFCIKPLLPVQNAGVVSCNGGVDLGVTSTQDHHIGQVGVDGFTADDCDAAGGFVEGDSDPHPGVCNGPVEVGASPQPDSGVGAVLVAPDARFGTQGLPVEISFDSGACATHQDGQSTVFGLVSAISRATIFNANNVDGDTFQQDAQGENFSCPNWMMENGPGALVLAVPAVHGAGAEDLITIFAFDD